MIKYALKCADGHKFDSWFQSGSAYDRLADAGHIACAICGSTDVEKSVMAPTIGSSDAQPPLSAPAHPAEQALREMKEKFEKSAENVGTTFPEEARKIHYGESEARLIYGEAKHEDAKALIEEGIPVAPLPWRTEPSN